MRNWPSCPNYETTTGPVCATIRRWGFPYSPLHPVFTPSRIHMDQTYRFYAGPALLLQGKPLRRRQGRRHRGHARRRMGLLRLLVYRHALVRRPRQTAPGQSAAGRRPKTCGALAFSTARATTRSSPCGSSTRPRGLEIAHGGAPTLHYDGHGQLWSRYPAQHTRLKAGTTIRQRNAYFFGGYRRHRGRRAHRTTAAPVAAPARGASGPGAHHDRRDGAAPLGPARARRSRLHALKPAIWKALAEIKDEQLYNLDAGIVDLGYVYDVREQSGVVSVLVTMPHRGRPEFNFLVTAGGGRISPGIRERVLKLPGVRDVVVNSRGTPLDRAPAHGKRPSRAGLEDNVLNIAHKLKGQSWSW